MACHIASHIYSLQNIVQASMLICVHNDRSIQTGYDAIILPLGSYGAIILPLNMIICLYTNAVYHGYKGGGGVVGAIDLYVPANVQKKGKLGT